MGHINKEYKFVTISSFFYCNGNFKPYFFHAINKNEEKIIYSYENI
jgi:hypothetical protein